MVPATTDGTKRRVPDRVRREKDARKIATILARGNVLLQSGNFETEKDVDKRRDALKNYEF
jgi:hypothetical protein